jgi:thioredoxin 1
MKVLKFGAIWCSGCLVMKPIWAEIEKELPSLDTEYYDVDQEKEISKKYDIVDLPTFIFLDKEGNEIHREIGEIGKETLIEIINQYKDE